MAHAEVPEVIKVAAYRHRYFGTPFHVLVQDLMRGPSSWTVGERELFAAFTSSRNQCQFCTTAHQAFAASCAGDDVVAVQAAGVDDLALEEAVRISALFHVINRIMDAAGAGPSKDHLWTSPAGSSWEGATSCRRPSAGSPVAIEPASENGTRVSAGLATLRQSCGNPTAPSSLAAPSRCPTWPTWASSCPVTAPSWRGSSSSAWATSRVADETLLSCPPAQPAELRLPSAPSRSLSGASTTRIDMLENTRPAHEDQAAPSG
jgi:AhpD family alkylhydroperoxidase